MPQEILFAQLGVCDLYNGYPISGHQLDNIRDSSSWKADGQCFACRVPSHPFLMHLQAEETARKNGEIRSKAEARITAALEANAAALQQRRAAFDEKQALTEQRSL